MTKLTLSHSAIALYLMCRRKYWLERIQRIEPLKKPHYLHAGNIVGSFLEAWYQGLPNPERIIDQQVKAIDTSLWSSEEQHKFKIVVAGLRGITEVYPDYYADDLKNYRKIMCERDITIPLTEHVNYNGKIDVLMQDAAGDWWVLETKTAAMSTVDANYLDRVRVDWQVTGYLVLAEELLGIRPRGVLYNVIKKPAIRLKKGESHEAFAQRVYEEYTRNAKDKQYFVREEVIIGRPQINQWRKEMSFVCEEIWQAHQDAKAIWPMNTGACIEKYGACKYFELCVSGGTVNPLLYRRKKPGER